MACPTTTRSAQAAPSPAATRAPLPRPCHTALSALHRQRACSWVPQQRGSAPRHTATLLLASGGSRLPAAPLAADSTRPPQSPFSLAGLQVTIEFVFAVEGCCTLRVRGDLAGLDAQRGVAIAAALIDLQQRQRALDAAVLAARTQLPGVLEPSALKAFDRMRAQGRPGAGMAVLGFSQLLALCAALAPDVACQIEEEMVEAATSLQANAMVPAPPDSAAAAAGTRLIVNPAFDLPSALVCQPQWQRWVRRLRDEIVGWQRQQEAEAREQCAAAAAAAAAAQLQQQQQATAPGGERQQQQAQPAAPAAPAGTPPGTLVASFVTNASTPDGLPMLQELRISVAPPHGRQLLQAIREAGLQLYASIDASLAPAAAAPEPQLQRHLEVAAWGLLRLGPDAAFSCALPAQEEAATDAANAAAAAAAGAGFKVSGSSSDLQMLVYALSWLEGDSLGAATSGLWVPHNGRIRVQRCASGGGGWLGLGRRGQQQGEASYELAVGAAAGEGEAAAAASTRLSQRQLNALLDCLDAYCTQHPGLVRLPLPDPLQAPAPGLLARLVGGG